MNILIAGRSKVIYHSGDLLLDKFSGTGTGGRWYQFLDSNYFV
jgi:hypothetical protein